MSSNSKYLFDNEFGAASVPLKQEDKAPPPPPVLYTEAEKGQFCTDAHQEGFAAGRSEALIGIEATITQSLENMNVQLQQLSQSNETRLENIRCEAASLSLAIANNLAPSLIARLPEAEVIKMVEDCLVDLHDEPRIVVRATDPICAALSEKMGQLEQNSGFQGNIILLPDDSLTGSDCRIEWADGGVERNLENTTQKISKIIDRFIRTNDHKK